jgi:serine/threonine protein phosphatase PrpC
MHETPARAEAASTIDAVLLLGSSLDAKGVSRSVCMSPGACAGLASGVASINPKEWVCEDSVLLARLDGCRWLAGVADAHYGGFSGEVVVQSALDAWQQTTATDTAERLREAVYEIDKRLAVRGQDKSETTVLLAHLQDGVLSWASVGDSVLWILGPHGVSEKNEPTLRFVGRHAIGDPPAAGSSELSAGDVVLLATDGILRVTSELEPEAIAARLRDASTSLEARVEALLAHMSEVGKDNLGVVALQA